MDSINTSFGGISYENGTPRLGTTIFGVDVNKMVENLVDAKKIPVTAKNVVISDNTAKITGLQTLKTLSTNLNNSLLNLRAPTVSMGGTDVFKAKAAFAQSSTSVQATQITGITVDKTADLGQFTLKVNRLATKDVINGTATGGNTAATLLTADGTLSINGRTLSLTTGMSLNAIKDAINADSANNNVTASVVKIDDTHFKLSLQAKNTGDAIDLTGSTGQVLTDLGLAASGASDTSLSAELVYNGNTVTRATNSVKDLVDGITFDLRSAEPASTLTVDIKRDAESVKDSIINFVDAYNALLEFSKSQRAVDAEGNVSADAVLFSDSTLRSLTSQAQSIIAGVVDDVTTGVNNLREAGITLDADNKLVIDNSKLDDHILENPDAIEDLFAFQSTTTNDSLFVISRPSALGEISGNAIDVRVSGTDGTGKASAATITYEGTTYTARVDNGVIYAPDDSPLKGFVFGYSGIVVNTGDPEQTAIITTTQGIAVQLSGMLDGFVKNTGGIDNSIQALTDRNDRINLEIDKITSQVELYRERITQQFLAAQQLVSQLQQVQGSIQASFDAMNNSNN